MVFGVSVKRVREDSLEMGPEQPTVQLMSVEVLSTGIAFTASLLFTLEFLVWIRFNNSPPLLWRLSDDMLNFFLPRFGVI